MPWTANEAGVVFECDSCGLSTEVNTAKVSQTRSKLDTNFTICWRYLQSGGWRSFKRTGRPWSYHCPGCGAEAEKDHADWFRHEGERERIKAYNAR
jgi:predicted RNA-binding Zn-ribbon protein involved in translation (DUF1610 family)